ncbi:Guanine nucleotide exchange factor, putative [Penicillium digitatum Pd1]|uniref:Guanine nucleotide exchange factor, putative n=1 Tax=Penicillium digitatum (strain Pd1 / CECT 20795) TaxID=1170230 RepID=K9FGP5_PEND1|nr:Guanine nucleotide exchange factor, putative [Penicillium digitatum Pd1]EKV07317.1 Guanine nucleotide exchange factor, putative [Penicillium digitatum Pd1]
MEPFPPIDPPEFKDAFLGPQVQINELPASNSMSSGVPQDPISNLRHANTVAQGSNVKRNLELKAAREKTATEINAKDSHELLRSQTHLGPLEARSPGRKVGHFTVRSVGQNGQIFLRPIANPSQKIPQPASFSSVDTAKPSLLQPQSHAHTRKAPDPSRWSSSQLSELRPRQQPEDFESVLIVPPPPELLSQHRMRPISFSTVSEQQSIADAGKRGELRIVIDRSEDRPKSAYENSTPTLEVPSLRYRLGSPRFNVEGSALMQSPAYTRNSMSDNFRNSTLLGGVTDLLPVLHGPYPRDSFSRHRPSFAISMFSGTAAAMDMNRASPALRNSMVYELKEPVEPSIYETMVHDMDDGSVVRYIAGTKDISAATPARIVAQISSESFMDYELVSDFFLTFRSYLSTTHLLALLLARLKWAINRLQDDGRIIRIRTFAALRHWILNYFVDDFVTNYELRTHFCETINKLYSEVRSRQNGGSSDRKILIDLKRCWNGKCSVYWASPDLSRACNDPEIPIVPGDAQIELPKAEELQQNVPIYGITPRTDSTVRESLAFPIQHDRTDSAATAQSIPLSAKSEQSLMALSCSLRPKSPRRLSLSASKDKAPRPVVLGLTNSKSPSRAHEPPRSPVSPMVSRRPYHSHSHKRSGSFSDSVREDRPPIFVMEPETGPAPQKMFDLISLIRGQMYPPADSFMTTMVPESPLLLPPLKPPNPDRRSTPNVPKLSPNSGMKTIIGSIKRALHTRNGGQSISALITTSHEAISLPSRGKTSAMPIGLAFGSELYRERKMAAVPKHPGRIDILCDEVLKQYRLAMNQEGMKDRSQPSAASDFHQATLQEPSSNVSNLFPTHPPNSDPKFRSGITMGSESIIIVDDTGFEMPSLSGSAQEPMPIVDDDAHEALELEVPDDASTQSIPSGGEYLRPMCYKADESAAHSNVSYPIRPLMPQRSSSAEGGSTPIKKMKNSFSLRLRKYASFQSGVSRQRLSMSSETTQSTVDSNAMHEQNTTQSGPVLRRRRGGNLRQMQTGDEPEPPSCRDSFASWDDSVVDGTALSDGTASRPPSTLIPPNPQYSLIQPLASQQTRRSFESVIAKFAQIPDDDDGGIESTLLKLEGKWDGPPNAVRNSSSAHAEGVETVRPGWDVLSRRRQTDKSAYSTVGGRLAPPRYYSGSVTESEESYDSIPLLERGLTDESMKWQSTSQPIQPGPHGAPLTLVSSYETSELASPHPSIQIVHKTDSMRLIPRGATTPASAIYDVGQVTPKRFSALSSELSVDLIDPHEAIGARFSTDTLSLGSSTVGIPSHPLAQPPSPPMTIQHPGSFTSYPSPLNTVLFQAQPLTPDTSPRHKEVSNSASRPLNIQQVSSDVLSNSENHRPDPTPVVTFLPDHVPFILACESQVLAQQLTLIEMAALSEVDWRDLVEMKWSSACPLVTNWVQFLTQEERKGIDLVVGRFNLMVKWILSEIVLTRDINERARTIIKYIHTAAHARRICNYATMLQIAIALSSSDCSRLQRTWQLISSGDKRLFKDMECLIQPVRNFNDLRVEMETANLQEGCIPFIGEFQNWLLECHPRSCLLIPLYFVPGLYVHDLTYNAQKPAQVNNTNGGLLVNFERYRTAARIVKSLLRLIDASTEYKFVPVQGIIERCLWIACLPEEEIQSRSKALE